MVFITPDFPLQCGKIRSPASQADARLIVARATRGPPSVRADHAVDAGVAGVFGGLAGAKLVWAIEHMGQEGQFLDFLLVALPPVGAVRPVNPRPC